MYKPLVSIIIPTYNEEEDIEKCLNAVLSLKYDKREIIVIDSASTDNTPHILRKYQENGLIKMISENERRGVSSARNLGINNANGEIVVLLNADIIPEKDFINKILGHYENGADFVVCESKVLNDNYTIPAYIQALHEYDYADREDLVWSEGFSCRKKALLDVGGFKPFPKGSAGEDAALGFELEKKYKRVLNKSIIVRHIVTTHLKDFLKIRYERGKGAAFFERYYLGKSLTKSFLIRVGKILFLVILLLIYPINLVAAPLILLWFTYQYLKMGYILSRKTGINGNLLRFAALNALDAIAMNYGYVGACIRCIKK